MAVKHFVAGVILLPSIALAAPASPQLRQAFIACDQHRNGSGGWLSGWEDCDKIVNTLWPQTDEGQAAAKEKKDEEDALAKAKQAEAANQAMIHSVVTGQ